MLERSFTEEQVIFRDAYRKFLAAEIVPHMERWREQGFAVVSGLASADVIADVAAAATDTFPRPGTDAARDYVGFGSLDRFVFPAVNEGFNALVLEPRILAAVAALLDVRIEDDCISRNHCEITSPAPSA